MSPPGAGCGDPRSREPAHEASLRGICCHARDHASSEIIERAAPRAVNALIAMENYENNGCKRSFPTGRQRVKLARADLDVDDDELRSLTSEQIAAMIWRGDASEEARRFISLCDAFYLATANGAPAC